MEEEEGDVYSEGGKGQSVTNEQLAQIMTTHWKRHAIQRYLERYLALKIDNKEIADLIPRIEARWRSEFDTLEPTGRRTLCIVSVSVWSNTPDPRKLKKGVVTDGHLTKVRLVYDYRSKEVVTALPHWLEPGKRRYLRQYPV